MTRGLTDEAFETLPCMAMLMRNGVVMARNALTRRLTGFSGVVDKPVPLEDVLAEASAFEAPNGERLRFDCLLLRRHGSPLKVSAAAQEIQYAGKACHLLLMMEGAYAGVSQTELEGSFLEDLLDATPGATVVTCEGRVLYVNEEFSRMFEYSQMEAVGKELGDLVIPAGRMHEGEMIKRQLGQSGRATLETQRRTRTGRHLDVSVMVSRLRLGGEARGQFVTYQDIHARKQDEARLRHTALHDELTGLANRTLFLNRAELTLARLKRHPQRSLAMMFLDLDGFKKVNDAMGHAAGDTVLLEIAERLRRCVRPQDTIARFGGDEFALLLDEAGTEEEVAVVARRLHEEVGRPIRVGGEHAVVSASIGIALGGPAYAESNAQVMLQHADEAMYAAKKAGRGGFRVCSTLGRVNEEVAGEESVRVRKGQTA